MMSLNRFTLRWAFALALVLGFGAALTAKAGDDPLAIEVCKGLQDGAFFSAGHHVRACLKEIRGKKFDPDALLACEWVRASAGYSQARNIRRCLRAIANRKFAPEIISVCEGLQGGAFFSQAHHVTACFRENGVKDTARDTAFDPAPLQEERDGGDKALVEARSSNEAPVSRTGTGVSAQ